MTTYYLEVQAIIPMDSGLPEDHCVNTWHFLCETPDRVTASNEVLARLEIFYGQIDGVLFPANVSTPMTFKFYDMEEASPRVPFATFTWALTNTATDPLPQEVAICLSYQGDAVSGVPQARRRGRVFLGPCTVAVSDDASGYARPSAALIAQLQSSAEELMDQTIADGNEWCVYSPTTDASSSLNDAFVRITNGWVDNTWDTQRRRGVEATSRNVWP